MKDTLAIIGSHPRTRADFDFERTDCDVWMFNEAISNKSNTWAKRADVVFQMHIPAIWKNPKNRNDSGHYEWLRNQTEVKNIYMQDVYPEVPASVKYPLDEVLGMLKGDPDHFLSSSVPQAIALGIYMRYKRIEIYGVAMESNTEYQWQREGVAFWKGFAMGRGIDFYFADPTYRTPLYGYEGMVQIEYECFDKRVNEIKPELEKISVEFQNHRQSVFAALEHFYTAGGGDAEKDLFSKVERCKAFVDMLGKLDGAIQENQRYKSRADTMKEAANDFIFSRQEFESAAAAQSKAVGQAEQEITVAGTQLDLLHASLSKSAKGSPKRHKIYEAYKQRMNVYLSTINRCGIYKGALNENYQYMAELDKGIRAAGGQKSVDAIMEQS